MLFWIVWGEIPKCDTVIASSQGNCTVFLRKEKKRKRKRNPSLWLCVHFLTEGVLMSICFDFVIMIFKNNDIYAKSKLCLVCWSLLKCFLGGRTDMFFLGSGGLPTLLHGSQDQNQSNNLLYRDSLLVRMTLFKMQFHPHPAIFFSKRSTMKLMQNKQTLICNHVSTKKNLRSILGLHNTSIPFCRPTWCIVYMQLIRKQEVECRSHFLFTLQTWLSKQLVT